MKGPGIAVTALFLLFFAALGAEGWPMDFIFRDSQYSFQALRAISATAGGAADIGECLMTTYRITEGDDESWFREWLKTAKQREKAGDEFLAKGSTISARQEFLRASNYYRTAEFFLRANPGDPRILSTWRRGRDCFLKFAKLADHPIIPVEIPFEGTTLPGYLCLADGSGKKSPLLIMQTGFDGTGEELYYSNAVFALRRGYNCLIFEGPGQGRVIREQRIPFRPNWETVVTPVVDFALKRREVDPRRIALMGISFGGYLVPRALAFEHRIAVAIANGGVYDFHSVVMKPGVTEDDLDDREGSAETDRVIYERMKKDPSLRWSFGNALFTFQAKTPSEWLRMTRPYTLKEVISRIRHPMLVVDSEGDRDMPGQSRRLYEALRGAKDFMLFTREEGAEEHCQVGAPTLSNERILDWLDKAMKRTGRTNKR